MEYDSYALLDGFTDTVLATDSEGVIVYANTAAEGLLGRQREHLVGKPIEELQPARLADDGDVGLRRILKSEPRPATMRVPVLHRDGTLIDVEAALSSFQQSEGNTLVICLLRDIRGRIADARQEEKIRHQLEFTSAITTNLTGGVCAFDRQGRIAFLNPAAEDLIGWHESEVLGRRVHEILHANPIEGSASHADCPLLAALGSDATVRVDDDVFSRNDGSFFPVAYTVSPFDTGGHPVGHVLAFQDMTERRKAAARLRESEERYRIVVETSPDGILMSSLDGTIVAANPRAAELFASNDSDGLIGLNAFELVAPRDRVRAMENVWSMVENGGSRRNVEFLMRRLGDETFEAEVSAAMFVDRNQMPTAITMIVRDVTSRKRAQEQLHRSEQRYRSVVETSPDAIVLVDHGGCIAFANERTVKLFRYSSSDDFVGLSVLDCVAPMDRDRALRMLQKRLALEDNQGQDTEYLLQRRDGTTFHAELASSALVDDHGRSMGLTILARDISERKQAQQALRESEESFRLLFARSPLPMWVYDMETSRFLEVNEAASLHYGYSRDDFLTMQIGDIRVPGEAPPELESAATTTESSVKMIRARHRVKGGKSIDVELVPHVIRFSGRHAMLVLAQDITEREAAADALRYRALHDPLTDLPNRALFRDRLEQGLRRAQRENSPLTLLYMDLDRFKEVNDTLGHRAGDLLLRLTGQRIGEVLRDSDTVARLGGDEFSVVLPSTDVIGAVEAARRILERVNNPAEIGKHTIDVATSIGIAVYPFHAEEAADLIDRADRAMYTAKRRHLGYAVYDPHLHDRGNAIAH